MLQGLLDSDGGPVTQRGRTCRIQYTTCSPRLRDDVVVPGALARRRGLLAHSPGGGTPPSSRTGAPCIHRSDAYVVDVRLPAGIEPFRLRRKRQVYRSYEGGGRPMRFVDAIEPAGEAETVCIQVAAADSLYVTDDFLRHPQHPELTRS